MMIQQAVMCYKEFFILHFFKVDLNETQVIGYVLCCLIDFTENCMLYVDLSKNRLKGLGT